MTTPVLGPPSVDEFWSVDDVSLHQFGWCIETVSGRYGVPPLRGDNGRAAGVAGEVWMPKEPDAYTLRLPMWVTGGAPATGAAGADPRRQWNDSWAFLRNVFWNPDAEFRLGRRWWRTDPATGDGTYLWSEALGQLAPGADLSPTMTSRTRATFAVDIRLAHPFFYGAAVTSPNIGVGGSWAVTNPGDWHAYMRNLVIELHGPLVNPRLTNTARPAGPLYCGLAGTVTAGEVLTLDVGAYLALSRKGSTVVNRTGEIYNSGTRPWNALLRGANTFTLSATGGGGYAVVRYRPPYL